ncbi:MAG: BMP family ABC transporter substrate-binding protein [Oscillospiraceae bacterium]|nr:BMP family ABC transporter substrate-binding protein [Oscillospiraceae bacterium]
MKRFLSLLLVLTMILCCFVACGTKTEEVAPEVQESKGKITYICQNLGDLSFNDNGWAGVNEVKEKYGYDIAVIEAGYDTSKNESILLDTADGDSNYIITPSNYGWSDLVFKYAKDYPDKYFIMFDVGVTTEVTDPNVACISYKQNEGSYLVGMVAAAMSTSGKIGACANRDVPIINDFFTGYIDGATTYNPDIKIALGYNTVAGDAAKMQEVASAMTDIGVDVIFNVGGAAGLGIFNSAIAHGTLAIGVDSDQYLTYSKSESPELADVIITSMLKNVGDSLVVVFDRIEDGTMKWGELTILGIQDGGVGIADNDYYKQMVPEDIRKTVAEYQEKVVKGEIVPKSYFDFADDSEFRDLAASVTP